MLEISDNKFRELCAREVNSSYPRSLNRLFNHSANKTDELLQTINAMRHGIINPGVYALEWDTAQIRYSPFSTTIQKVGNLNRINHLLQCM